MIELTNGVRQRYVDEYQRAFAKGGRWSAPVKVRKDEEKYQCEYCGGDLTEQDFEQGYHSPGCGAEADRGYYERKRREAEIRVQKIFLKAQSDAVRKMYEASWDMPPDRNDPNYIHSINIARDKIEDPKVFEILGGWLIAIIIFIGLALLWTMIF